MSADALTGPPPRWRPGYEDEEPAYRETVRALGIPGLGKPTGGDVVQGVLEDIPDGELPGMWERADFIDTSEGPNE